MSAFVRCRKSHENLRISTIIIIIIIIMIIIIIIISCEIRLYILYTCVCLNVIRGVYEKQKFDHIVLICSARGIVAATTPHLSA